MGQTGIKENRVNICIIFETVMWRFKDLSMYLQLAKKKTAHNFVLKH